MQHQVATWTMPLGDMRLLYIQQLPGEFVIGLETDSSVTPCPQCASTETVGYGRANLRIRDLPIEGKNVLLDVKRRRLRCQRCNKTFNEPIRHISEHHRATERLVDLIGRMALSRPFSAISREMDMDEKTIRMIFADLLEQLKGLPLPHIPETVVLWTPVILRIQRAVWVNHTECTVVAMDPDTNPSTIKATLQRFRTAGGASTILVPLDPAIITPVQEFEGIVLKPHIGSLETEYACVFDDCASSPDTEKYATALHRFFQAKTDWEAEALWKELPAPPAAIRAKLRNMLAAIDLLGAACFIGACQQDQACDTKIRLLGSLLASGFSRRSYDVLYAVMVLDKHLYKTCRMPIDHSSKPALLGYEKINFGTSIPKLINRLKGMVIDAAVETEMNLKK